MVATRDRVVAASLELMRRNGYAGTGVKAILRASDAPYGSMYHHFPGGKEELGAATIREGGRAYRALVESFFPRGGDVVQCVGAFFAGAAEFVESTEFVDACPIATIAGEIASASELMRTAAADAFASWLAVVEARLDEAGVEPARARELAVECFCSIEGAFLLSRTTRDSEPIRIAGRAAVRALRTELRTRARVTRA